MHVKKRMTSGATVGADVLSTTYLHFISAIVKRALRRLKSPDARYLVLSGKTTRSRCVMPGSSCRHARYFS